MGKLLALGSAGPSPLHADLEVFKLHDCCLASRQLRFDADTDLKKPAAGVAPGLRLRWEDQCRVVPCGRHCHSESRTRWKGCACPGHHHSVSWRAAPGGRQELPWLERYKKTCRLVFLTQRVTSEH
ncbi:hypothetical protein DBR06_SOUSAS21810015 [Sousa chinensis]|uniref:Uncharacterized protein n=1 Tax=Sousa chinensis TaxID=103600 RepID=A0A484GI27_SOUCH|nr:hypothetical protein DBR06_SOUSAS21810015 [Sousa chinensis]